MFPGEELIMKTNKKGFTLRALNSPYLKYSNQTNQAKNIKIKQISNLLNNILKEDN
jgi:hypothetical protein